MVSFTYKKAQKAHKKHKNANKRISNFFPLRCFLSAFSLIYVFVLLVRVKSFRKKKKNCPNDLIYITTPKAYSEPCQTSVIEHFTKIADGYNYFTNYNYFLNSAFHVLYFIK